MISGDIHTFDIKYNICSDYARELLAPIINN